MAHDDFEKFLLDMLFGKEKKDEPKPELVRDEKDKITEELDSMLEEVNVVLTAMAKSAYDLMQTFISVGFTREEAFKLVANTLKGGSKND